MSENEKPGIGNQLQDLFLTVLIGGLTKDPLAYPKFKYLQERGRMEDAYHQARTKKLQQEEEERKRPASIPVPGINEIPSGGIGTLPSGEIPQYDVPTETRKEFGIKQVPIPGYTMGDIKNLPFEQIYKFLQPEARKVISVGGKGVYEHGKEGPGIFTPAPWTGKEEEPKVHGAPIAGEGGYVQPMTKGPAQPVMKETPAQPGWEDTGEFARRPKADLKPGLEQVKKPPTERASQHVVDTRKYVKRFGTFNPDTETYKWGKWESTGEKRATDALYNGWEAKIDKRLRQTGADARLSSDEQERIGPNASIAEVVALFMKKGLSEEAARTYKKRADDLYRIRDLGLEDIENDRDPNLRLKDIGKAVTPKAESAETKPSKPPPPPNLKVSQQAIKGGVETNWWWDPKIKDWTWVEPEKKPEKK